MGGVGSLPPDEPQPGVNGQSTGRGRSTGRVELRSARRTDTANRHCAIVRNDHGCYFVVTFTQGTPRYRARSCLRPAAARRFHTAAARAAFRDARRLDPRPGPAGLRCRAEGTPQRRRQRQAGDDPLRLRAVRVRPALLRARAGVCPEGGALGLFSGENSRNPAKIRRGRGGDAGGGPAGPELPRGRAETRRIPS